ncbi:type II toxin-antitoxin system VapC family toxin [Thermodesulfobacteriota bacterium]
MVLVDTSVWVSHLREGNVELENLLNEGLVACHPFVIGELACGNLKNRDEILALLQTLTAVEMVEDDEVLHFIERNGLMGKGLGLIDIHLLASALLADIPLWTLDKRLEQVSFNLKVCYEGR